MSKEPSCAKAQHNTPVTTENGRGRRRTEAWRMLLSTSPRASTTRLPPVPTPCTFHQKGCQYTPHVMALDVGPGLQGRQQRSDVAQHPPAAQTDDGNIPMEQVSAAGRAADSRKVGQARKFIPVKCNIHPWMHGWYCGGKRSIRDHRRRAVLTPSKLAAGEVHGDCLAGRLRHSDAEVTVAAGKTATADFTFKAK